MAAPSRLILALQIPCFIFISQNGFPSSLWEAFNCLSHPYSSLMNLDDKSPFKNMHVPFCLRKPKCRALSLQVIANTPQANLELSLAPLRSPPPWWGIFRCLDGRSVVSVYFLFFYFFCFFPLFACCLLISYPQSAVLETQWYVTWNKHLTNTILLCQRAHSNLVSNLPIIITFSLPAEHSSKHFCYVAEEAQWK